MADFKQLDLPNQYNELTPLEETDIFVPGVDFARVFLNTTSNEYKNVQRTFQGLIGKNKEALNAIRDGIIRSKNEMYQKFNLDALL